MHLRRLSALLLGGWLSTSIWMAVVATHNFHAVDTVLEQQWGPAARDVRALGRDEARAFLRYEAGELNRWYFEAWEWVQIGLGVLLLGLLASAVHSRAALFFAALMLACTLGMRFFLTPQIVEWGRAIDFLPPAEASPERTRFWHLHTLYSITEMGKLALGFALAALLMRRRSRRPNEAAEPLAHGAHAR